MFKKDVATLLQCIQHILLNIHQYMVQIIYKPGPEFFYCGLVITVQPHRGQRQTYQRYGHQDRCNTKHDRHTRVHVHVTNTAGIHTG